MTISDDQARRLAASLGEVAGRAGAPTASPVAAEVRNSGDFTRILVFASSLALAIGLSPGAAGVPSRRPGLQEENAMRREAVLAAAVSLLGSQVATAQVDAVEWRVEDGGNGHWYAFVVESHTWSAASEVAALRGGYLATIRSSGEGVFVRSLGAEETWIGLYQDSQSGDYVEPGGGWRWITEEPLDYTNWRVNTNGQPNEPNDLPGGENYGLIDSGATTWNDGQDIPLASYTIEWSADCDQNGLVDYGEIVRGEKTDANANGVPDCCESPAGCCPCDIDGDGAVNGIDLAIVLARWGGPAKDYPKADGDGNGIVDGADLALVLGAWGACE